MIVEKNKLAHLCQYNDERIRDACSEALTRFFNGSDGVIEIFLNAIEKFPNECLSLSAQLSNFIPTDNDIMRIVRLVNSIDPLENDYNTNIHFHLKNSFIGFPFQIIERNQEIICFNKELAEVIKIAKIREEIKSKDPDDLWQELDRLCSRYNNKYLKGTDRQYANLLFEGLARHPSQISYKVIMSLSLEIKKKYHFEEYMVQLAGKFRLEETISPIFKIFENTNHMHIVNETCIRALGSIGGLNVINSVKSKYNSSDDDHRSGLISILKYVPFSFSEDLAIELLKNEINKSNKTYLSGVLCDIFSLKGMDYVLKIIERKEYDPQIMHLFDCVLPVYFYHKIDTDKLSNIENEDKYFIENELKNDPLYQASEPLRKYFDSISENKSKNNVLKKDNVIPILEGASKRKSKRRKKRKK